MSNRGPAPYWNRNAGFGCQDSGPGVWNVVMAVSGVPMSPRSISRRAVCSPAPRNVSGAQPSRSPAASADFSRPRPDSRSSENGFSVQTCLPALTAAVATSTCAAGMVRLTMISTSGWFRAASTPPHSGDAVFLGARRGGLFEEIGDDVDLEVGEDGQVVQVLLADVAGADDGDAHRAAAGGGLDAVAAHAFTPCAPGRNALQVVEALGDAVEDVAGVVVEFHDADFEGLAASMTSHTAILPWPAGCCALVSVETGPSLMWMNFTRSPRRCSSCDRVLAADGRPVGVHFQDEFRVQESVEVLQRGLALDAGLQLPGVVVVADADAVPGALLGGGVELRCGGLDVLGGLPVLGRQVGIDHRADAQFLGRGEDFVLVLAQQRGVAGRGGQAVFLQGRAEFGGRGDEVVGLNLGEAELGDLLDGAGQVFLQGVAEGVELD